MDPGGTRTSTLELNMTFPGLVHSVPGQLEAAGIQLDVLVNNAGIFPRDCDPVDGLRQTLETNVMGAVALTMALSGHLLNAPELRVVMVSSVLGSFGQCAGEGAPLVESNFLAYQTSKAALNMATVCLAKQFAGAPLIPTTISPGWCRTDMGGADAPRSAREGAEVIYRAATLRPVLQAAPSSVRTARCLGRCRQDCFCAYPRGGSFPRLVTRTSAVVEESAKQPEKCRGRTRCSAS